MSSNLFIESRQVVIACGKRLAVIDTKGWSVLLVFPETGTPPLCALFAKKAAERGERISRAVDPLPSFCVRRLRAR
jgi:hypothetical protein